MTQSNHKAMVRIKRDNVYPGPSSIWCTFKSTLMLAKQCLLSFARALEVGDTKQDQVLQCPICTFHAGERNVIPSVDGSGIHSTNTHQAHGLSRCREPLSTAHENSGNRAGPREPRGKEGKGGLAIRDAVSARPWRGNGSWWEGKARGGRRNPLKPGPQKAPQDSPVRTATASLAGREQRPLPSPCTMHSLGAGPDPSPSWGRPWPQPAAVSS